MQKNLNGFTGIRLNRDRKMDFADHNTIFCVKNLKIQEKSLSDGKLPENYLIKFKIQFLRRINGFLHFFLYRNTFYKNTEAQITQKLRKN